MALEHAILVSLLEQPGSGYELARRFDRSIGYFWTATHQQIYRVLKRMENDGWIEVRAVQQQARPDKKEHSVTPASTAPPSRPGSATPSNPTASVTRSPSRSVARPSTTRPR